VETEARPAAVVHSPEPEVTKPQVDPATLPLPTDADEQMRYLTTSYKGVGRKTAEKLVEGFGEDLFQVLQKEPERVQDLIPSGRADTVLEQWRVDYDRRRSQHEDEPHAAPKPAHVEPERPIAEPALAEARTDRAAPTAFDPPAIAREPEQPVATTPEPASGATSERKPESGSELDGLEPSRLRGRTSRGRRR
jgi:hypothetical protein